MNILLIAVVLFAVACGALWHNQSPRMDVSSPSRRPSADKDPGKSAEGKAGLPK